MEFVNFLLIFLQSLLNNVNFNEFKIFGPGYCMNLAEHVFLCDAPQLGTTLLKLCY